MHEIGVKNTGDDFQTAVLCHVIDLLVRSGPAQEIKYNFVFDESKT